MRRFLLDTCVLIWILKDDKRIKGIKDDIDYYQGDYAISVESLKEYLYLVQSGKLKTDIAFDELLRGLKEQQISVLSYEKETLEELSRLPFIKTHPDPSDRAIIAQAISDNRILITGDRKFANYSKLKLLQV